MLLRPIPCNPLRFEALFWEMGYKLVAGLDEAGRGCLAGPVVAAAVIMPEGLILDGVTDSKAVSEEDREGLYEIIKEASISFCVAEVSHDVIDDINILNASLLAMKRALQGLNPLADAALIDGNRVFDAHIPLKAIPKADVLSHTVGAASIIAKVHRDRLMREYHNIYPQYNFAKNKGYPTKEHKMAIRQYGPCPIHRMTFKGVLGDGGR